MIASSGPVRCLDVAAHVDAAYGGVVSSLADLRCAMAAGGRYRSTLAAFCDPGEETAPGLARDEVLRFPLSRLEWWKSPSARRNFQQAVSAAGIVHIHGLWQLHSTAALTEARRLGRPVVISAHGMLDSWALQKKGYKKKLYLGLGYRRLLAGAACLRALTEDEAGDYRRAGLLNPVVVIPNGVARTEEGDAPMFYSAFPALRGARLLLFLGRLHRKKGLPVLLEAWSMAREALRDCHLVIAGPDSENHLAELREAVHQRNVAGSVTFAGLLAGGLKSASLAACGGFVLPSYSEGLSMAALEAMGAGCPVVLSPGCHLPEAARQGCGWIVEPKPAELARVLTEWAHSSEAELRSKGEAGRRFVSERYSWSTVARQVAEVFDWLRGCGPAPSTRV